MSAADVGLALMAPPETPGERVAILRTAFTAMLGDPEFKKEGAMIEPDMDPLPGDKLQALIAATQVDSPQLLEKVRRIVNTE
jgi:tripartite-type tricarboxylate transporter receptor subunit TctC